MIISIVLGILFLILAVIFLMGKGEFVILANTWAKKK